MSFLINSFKCITDTFNLSDTIKYSVFFIIHITIKNLTGLFIINIILDLTFAITSEGNDEIVPNPLAATSVATRMPPVDCRNWFST